MLSRHGSTNVFPIQLPRLPRRHDGQAQLALDRPRQRPLVLDTGSISETRTAKLSSSSMGRNPVPRIRLAIHLIRATQPVVVIPTGSIWTVLCLTRLLSKCESGRICTSRVPLISLYPPAAGSTMHGECQPLIRILFYNRTRAARIWKIKSHNS